MVNVITADSLLKRSSLKSLSESGHRMSEFYSITGWILVTMILLFRFLGTSANIDQMITVLAYVLFFIYRHKCKKLIGVCCCYVRSTAKRLLHRLRAE